MNTRRIDAHQHFWRPARGDYGWLRADVPAVRPLVRDVMPVDLAPALQRHGVLQTVLVQAAPTEAETDFLLSIADSTGFVGAVVGWTDLSSDDAIATLERWSAHGKFRGVRPMLQDLPEADWIATRPRPAVVERLKRLGLRLDGLVKPPQLPALVRFVAAHPDLPVVLDHAAKPTLANGIGDDWRAGIAALARHPQVDCKWSGLLTEALPAQCATRQARIDLLRPVFDHLLDTFGPARLMWGSDWPVLELASDYDAWVDASAALVGELSADEQDAIWRRNAMRAYALDGAA